MARVWGLRPGHPNGDYVNRSMAIHDTQRCRGPKAVDGRQPVRLFDRPIYRVGER